MKKKKFDLEPKIEKLEDILEERLESIEDRLTSPFSWGNLVVLP